MRCIGSFLSRNVPHRDSSDTTDGKAIRRITAAVAEATRSGRNTHGVRISAPHCLPRHDTLYRRRVEADGVPHLSSRGDATTIRYAIFAYREPMVSMENRYAVSEVHNGSVCFSVDNSDTKDANATCTPYRSYRIGEDPQLKRKKISGIGFPEHE